MSILINLARRISPEWGLLLRSAVTGERAAAPARARQRVAVLATPDGRTMPLGGTYWMSSSSRGDDKDTELQAHPVVHVAGDEDKATELQQHPVVEVQRQAAPPRRGRKGPVDPDKETECQFGRPLGTVGDAEDAKATEGDPSGRFVRVGAGDDVRVPVKGQAAEPSRVVVTWSPEDEDKATEARPGLADAPRRSDPLSLVAVRPGTKVSVGSADEDKNTECNDRTPLALRKDGTTFARPPRIDHTPEAAVRKFSLGKHVPLTIGTAVVSALGSGALVYSLLSTLTTVATGAVAATGAGLFIGALVFMAFYVATKKS